MIKICFILFFALGQLVAQEASISDIPNGYQEIDSGEDLYSSPINSAYRPYQERLLDLEQKVFGLSRLGEAERMKQAQLAYQMEFEILAMHIEIANLKDGVISKFEKDSLLFTTTHLYRNLMATSERLFNDMVRFLDVVLPGPNGPQFREGDNLSDGPYYYPNYRSAEVLSDQQKQDFFDEKLQSFLSEGGSLDEIYKLDQARLNNLGAFTWFEYAQLLNDDIMVTEGKAGHLLLADGKRAKAAGQIVLVKNIEGEVTFAIVTNASGTYKPDILSAQRVALKLQNEFNIASDRIIFSKGEPLSTQIFEMYMKGYGVEKKEAKAKVASLKALSSHKISGQYKSVSCQKFFR